MNLKSICYYLGLFSFPISILAFINILYSSYFDYFLSINSYIITLIFSFLIGSGLFLVGKKAIKRINDNNFGYCEETGEPIGLKRLIARPIATLCIEAQEKHEKNEKIFADI